MVSQIKIPLQQVGCVFDRSCERYWFHLCTVAVSLDSEPSLPHLMEKVAAKIPDKYETVGLQLGCTHAELQEIRPQHPSFETHQRAFSEMFSVWRRRGLRPYTWRTIIGVLRSARIGEVQLSKDLMSWIASTSKIAATGGMRLTFTLYTC